MPATNHWHESLLATDQQGSVEAMKDLGEEVCAHAAKMLVAQEAWGFPAQCTTEPTFVRPEESSLSLSTQQLAEKQLYRMHLYNSLVRHWDSSSFELTETKLNP